MTRHNNLLKQIRAIDRYKRFSVIISPLESGPPKPRSSIRINVLTHTSCTDVIRRCRYTWRTIDCVEMYYADLPIAYTKSVLIPLLHRANLQQ